MTTPPSEQPQAFAPQQFAPPPQHAYGPGGYFAPAPYIAPGGHALAHAGLRLAAYLIDGVLVSLPLYVLMLVLALAGAGLVRTADDPGQDDDGEVLLLIVLLFVVGLIVISLVSAGLSYLYTVTYQGRVGTTIGKRLMKIRTVQHPDGSPITVPVARRRWLASHGVALLGLIPFVGSITGIYTLIDDLWLLWDKPLQQCLHDKYAKTIVIKLHPAETA